MEEEEEEHRVVSAVTNCQMRRQLVNSIADSCLGRERMLGVMPLPGEWQPFTRRMRPNPSCKSQKFAAIGDHKRDSQI